MSALLTNTVIARWLREASRMPGYERFASACEKALGGNLRARRQVTDFVAAFTGRKPAHRKAKKRAKKRAKRKKS